MTIPSEPVPTFVTEVEERAGWEAHDSADYLDWSKAASFRRPILKPWSTAISLRLPNLIPERIEIAANKRDVRYQSLIRMWPAEQLDTL